MSESFLSLAIFWFVAIAAPGPDVFQILRLGMTHKKNGFSCALGIMLGNTVWVITSLIGLGALIVRHPAILQGIQFLGGCYLIYLGYCSIKGPVQSMIKSKGSFSSGITQLLEEKPQSRMNAQKAFFLGLSTNLSNPKALIFFLSVFSQFLGVAPSYIIALFIISTGILWFCSIAVAVHMMGRWLGKYHSVLDTVCGIVFIIVGIILIYEGR